MEFLRIARMLGHLCIPAVQLTQALIFLFSIEAGLEDDHSFTSPPISLLP